MSLRNFTNWNNVLSCLLGLRLVIIQLGGLRNSSELFVCHRVSASSSSFKSLNVLLPLLNGHFVGSRSFFSLKCWESLEKSLSSVLLGARCVDLDKDFGVNKLKTSADSLLSSHSGRTIERKYRNRKCLFFISISTTMHFFITKNSPRSLRLSSQILFCRPTKEKIAIL